MTNARQMCCGSATVTRATSSSSSPAGLFLARADTANNSHLLLYTRRRYGFTALPPSFHTYPSKNVIDIDIFCALLIVKVWLVRENYILFAANIRKMNGWSCSRLFRSIVASLSCVATTNSRLKIFQVLRKGQSGIFPRFLL